MDTNKLSKGTELFFGEPAEPMDELIVDAITQVVNQQPEILEAHLPQCYIEGSNSVSQILVIGVQTAAEIPAVMATLGEKMGLLLGEGNYMDMMPFSVASLPPEARQVTILRLKTFPTTSRNLAEPPTDKPWWKFW